MYGEVNAAKAMKDTAETVFMQPICSPRKYYKFWTEQQISDCETMVDTSNGFNDGQLNIKLV